MLLTRGRESVIFVLFMALAACATPSDSNGDRSGPEDSLAPVYHFKSVNGELPGVLTVDNAGRIVIRMGSLVLSGGRYTSELVLVRERWLGLPDTMTSEEVLRSGGTYEVIGDTLVLLSDMETMPEGGNDPGSVDHLLIVEGGRRLEGRSFFGVPYVLERAPIIGP